MTRWAELGRAEDNGRAGSAATTCALSSRAQSRDLLSAGSHWYAWPAERVRTAEPLTTVPNNEAFYAGAVDRISRFMLVLAVVLSAAAWWRYGWRIALGFACGSVVAYLNFYWLKRVVGALADRATQPGQVHSSSGVVLRFLLRYVLMGLGAYVIFTVSPASLYGLFAGLFLPVGAIACEAACETWVALRG